jgi:glutaredoxin
MSKVWLVTNSLSANRVEYEHSCKIRGLFDLKGVPFEEIDVVSSTSSIPQLNIRHQLYASSKLYKTKRPLSISQFPVPQIFVENIYLGGYLELQILEDTGQLDEILSGRRCPHVYLHFQQGILQETWYSFKFCPMCTEDGRLVVYIDASYPANEEDHQLLLTLWRSHIAFQVVDIDNPVSSLERGVKVFGENVYRRRLISAICSNVIMEVLNRERCMYCLNSTILRSVCAKCSKEGGKEVLEGIAM